MSGLGTAFRASDVNRRYGSISCDWQKSEPRKLQTNNYMTPLGCCVPFAVVQGQWLMLLPRGASVSSLFLINADMEVQCKRQNRNSGNLNNDMTPVSNLVSLCMCCLCVVHVMCVCVCTCLRG